MFGEAVVAFNPRASTPALNAQVGTIKGNADSLTKVGKNIELYWATRVNPVNTLRMDSNVYVEELGMIILPQNVVIDKGWELDICGSISPNTDTMTVRENGALRISYPALAVQLGSLEIDYGGRLEPSQYCDTTNNKVNLNLDFFNTTSDFSLDTTKFSLSSGTVLGNATQSAPALAKTFCSNSSVLELFSGQTCTLQNGTYTYENIVIHPGAELVLEGDVDGLLKTIIDVNIMDIMFEGKISGIGAGFETGGTGQGTAGTYGGRGVDNTASTYGSISSPTLYGSNGDSGRGGGQIKLVITGSLNLDGTIDMSAGSGLGGSGGSILIQTPSISGDGYLKAKGGEGGGGGGRIAVISSSTYEFTGEIDASGGEASDGRVGSPGIVYFVYI